MKYYKDQINSEILAILDGVNICKYNIEKDRWKMSVFFSTFDSQEHLRKSWKDVSSTIGSTFQLQLKGQENEFEKWNIYIIYMCNEIVDKELKNRIENDKFSSRKIVEDNSSNDLTTEIVEEIIIKHITNTDLLQVVDNTPSNEESLYISSIEKIWSIIPKDDSISRNMDKQKDLFEQIKQLHNENKKS